MGFVHTSVMPAEVLAYQNLKPGDVCVDGTLGGAGHALSAIQAILPGGTLIGIDQDLDAITNAQNLLHPFKQNVILVHDNFSCLSTILDRHGIKGVNAILLDLGFSLNQITQAKRGFSFNRDEPLDMRMDTRQTMTAQTIVNTFEQKMLTDLFFSLGEEKFSRSIARAIVRQRQVAPIKTTLQLTRIILDTVPKGRAASQKIHPATRIFQALRIAVNRELENLATFMEQVPDLLVKGGRICVISFHSLEDRIVKQQLKKFEARCTCPKDLPRCVCHAEPTMRPIVKKPLTPTPEETAANPMARSARLRVAERV
ncbi:MAG: 16S rRNA (cytosine(1402)-N(4))-methyltransferase RsmH [Desulfotignum sp.]|nr:16S rRNA (cytosine(1402)-N(4))-methyltransferase RsmH [Desulfotignum sp.]MCF8124679.1 16S rRNA (cytosine(1402)-N(4))-methyltransferase RsmH [Desulfotignum sp.]